jgi:hypothetical protein
MTPEIVVALILKFMGAAAGAALALVFVPPKTRQGFYRRLTAALIFGTVFANYVRGYLGFDPDADGLVAAACLTGFVSWWLMGAIKRVADAWQAPKQGQED